MITKLSQDWGNTLGGYRQNLVCTRSLEKEAMTPQETESDLPVSVQESWRRKWQPTPVLLSGNFHGLRSLVGYSSWDSKELDMTERLHFSFKEELR